MTLKTPIGTAAGIAAALTFSAGTAQAVAPIASQLEKRKCAFEQVRLRKVECYWLVAPLRRDVANGKTIRIPVAVFRARKTIKGKAVKIGEPVLFISGGPGGRIGAVAENYKHWRRVLKIARWIGNRDLILFEQRGVPTTKPRLHCLEQRDWRGRPVTEERYVKVMLACHYRIKKWRLIDLAGFTTQEIVADMIDIRRLLRIEKWTLWGGSYGSLLALETLRRDEAATRSVVISGVLPPHKANEALSRRYEVRALKRMIAACHAQKKCRKAFPKLAKTMYRAIKRLRRQPIDTAIVGGDNMGGHFYEIDDKMLMNAMFGMLYRRKSMRYMPMLFKSTLGDVDRAYVDSIAAGADSSYYRSSSSLALLFAVDCNDRIIIGAEPPDPKAMTKKAGKPIKFSRYYRPFKRHMERRLEVDLKLCRVWRATKQTSIVAKPVRSKVPVLIINGYLDPVTPPENAREAAKYLPNSHLFIMRHASHAAELTKCGVRIKRAFIRNPKKRPKAACLAKMKPVKFITKEFEK
jgi:pimeloyl-ACP methyl ester carboxylesterase